MRDILLIGAPVDSGKARRGCLMGPDALRVAGIADNLRDLGHQVRDLGNVALDDSVETDTQRTISWTRDIADLGQRAMDQGLPVFLGGDHALSMGSVSGVTAHAASHDRPQYVLWLDAHSDFHTPETSDSGNLHGTPVGYVTGRKGFDAFPPLPHCVSEDHICMMGLRSVDQAERAALEASDITYHDMRQIDEAGFSAPLKAFLDRVRVANGALHVSLDVDFLDPLWAPAVGTTVPGGATVREAHLIMEILHDSGLITSMDLVELNPFLDERGKTAKLMVDLAASAMGRRIFDRPTRSY